MPLPNNFCSQVHRFFNGNDRTFQCQVENSTFTAQWEPTANKDYILPNPVSLFQNPAGNPKGIWLLEWQRPKAQEPLRMIATEHQAGPPIYPASQIMALTLIRAGLIIQEGTISLQSPWHNCPSTLELLTTAGRPRLVAGHPLKEVPESARTLWERLRYDGISAKHRQWLDQIKAAQDSKNRPLLLTLCVLLNHEVMQTWSTYLTAWSDRLITFNEHGSGRLIYRAANCALQSLR
jgi:hypothetical protein